MFTMPCYLLLERCFLQNYGSGPFSPIGFNLDQRTSFYFIYNLNFIYFHCNEYSQTQVVLILATNKYSKTDTLTSFVGGQGSFVSTCACVGHFPPY